MARSHLSPAVATCRQTVEALLVTPPPLGSGWLRFVSGSNEYLPKQRGLLLHPPLSHKPPYTEQRSYHHHARLRQRGHADPKCFDDAARRELLGVFSNVLGKFDRCDISRIGREEDPF